VTGSDRERDVAALVEVILARYLAGYNQELQTPLTREDIADDSGHMFYTRTYAEAVLASDWLAAHDKAIAAKALREAADAWTQGAWPGVMLPKPTPPAVPVIAYASRVGDWLRDRADRIEAEDA
jgi:hypothetical protein